MNPTEKPPVTTRRRRLRWRTSIAAVLLAAGVAILLHLPPVQRLVADRVLASLGESLGSEFSCGELRANVFTGSLRVRELALQTSRDGRVCTRITVDEVDAAVSLPALLAGRIVVSSLQVHGVAALVGRDSTGELVLPQLQAPEQPAEPGKERPRLSFEAVVLDDAKLVLSADAEGRTIELDGVSLEGACDVESLSGRGSLRVDSLRGELPRLRFDERLELSWRLHDGAGEAELALAGPVSASGRLVFDDLLNPASYRGDGDLEAPLEIVGELLAPDIGLAGVLTARVFTTDGRLVVAELRAEGLTGAGFTSQSATATASYQDGDLELSGVAVQLAGGTIEGRGHMRLMPVVGEIDVAVTARGLDLAELLAPFGSGVEVTGIANGELELAAPTPDLDAVVATLRAAVDSPRINGRNPGVLHPQLRLEARLADGLVDLEPVELRDGATRLKARGVLNLEERSWRGEIVASSPELAPYLALAGLDGGGALDCSLRGAAGLDRVSAAGDVRLTALRVGAFTMERAGLELRIEDRRVDMLGRDLEVAGVSGATVAAGVEVDEGGGSTVTLDVSGARWRGAVWPDVHVEGELGDNLRLVAATGDRQATVELRRIAGGPLEVDAAFEDFRLSQLAPLLSDRVEELSGVLSGTAALSFDSDYQLVGGQLAVRALTVRSNTHEMSLLEPVSGRLEGKALWIDGLALGIDGSSRFDLEGSVDLAAGIVDLEVMTRDLDLAPWGRLAGVELGGRCTAAATVRGGLRWPELDGSIAVDELRVDQLNVTAIRGRFDLMEDGAHTAELSLSGVAWGERELGMVLLNARRDGESFRLDGSLLDGQLVLAGTVGAVAPWPVDCALSFGHLEWQELADLTGVPAGLAGNLSGRLQLTGPVAEPASLTLALSIPRADLAFGEVTVTGELDAVMARGVLRVNEAKLSNPSMSASVHGALPLDDEAATPSTDGLRIELRGGLGFLLALLPSLDRAQGALDGSVLIGGSVASPSFSGSLTLAGGSLDGPSFPAPLDQIGGRLTATQDRFLLEDVSARFAGGTVEASGSVALTGTSPGSLAGTIRVRGVDAPLSPSFDLAGEADLSLAGTLAEPRVAGELRVLQATHTPKIDLLALLRTMTETAFALRPRTPLAAVRSDEARTPVDLDLLVLVPGSLEIVGSAINATLSARLQVAGSTEKPAVTGGITVDEGDIKLFGSEFELSNGTLDFIDPDKVDPELLISAVTSKGGDRITVAITGHASKPYLQLSSDAGHSQEEIIAILAGGMPGGTGILPTDMLVNAAARSAAGTLATRIGLASDVEIIPFPVTPEGDKLLFLVGKELGRGFVVRYGLASESGESDVVEVVAELGDRSVARLRQNTDGTVSGGFRLKGTIR